MRPDFFRLQPDKTVVSPTLIRFAGRTLSRRAIPPVHCIAKHTETLSTKFRQIYSIFSYDFSTKSELCSSLYVYCCHEFCKKITQNSSCCDYNARFRRLEVYLNRRTTLLNNNVDSGTLEHDINLLRIMSW